MRADYIGFQIPNEFVVGYGMDYAERYRNLKDICVLSLTSLESEPKSERKKDHEPQLHVSRKKIPPKRKNASVARK